MSSMMESDGQTFNEEQYKNYLNQLEIDKDMKERKVNLHQQLFSSPLNTNVSPQMSAAMVSPHHVSGGHNAPTNCKGSAMIRPRPAEVAASGMASKAIMDRHLSSLKQYTHIGDSSTKKLNVLLQRNHNPMFDGLP